MFEVETSLIFWSAISFAVLLLLLSKLVLPPLLNMIEARKALIQKNLQDAEAAKGEAAEKLNSSRQKLAEANARAEKIMSQSAASAEQQKGQIVSQAQTQAQKIIQQSQAKIQADTQNAKLALQKDLAQLVSAASSKVIQKTLSDAEHARLIDQSLARLEKQL